MAKDPAFLFYPGDWTGGTLTMDFAEQGAYMSLLILQFNQGDFSEQDVKRILKTQFKKIWPVLREKFTEDNGRFFNQRLFLEMEKRQQHSKIQRDNINKRWNKVGKGVGIDVGNTTVLPLENENENTVFQVSSKRGPGGNSSLKNFIKPEPGILTNYFSEIGLDEFTAQAQTALFFDHYNSNGWKVGKNSMKDWKAAARNWKSRMNEYKKNQNGSNSNKSNKPGFTERATEYIRRG